MASLKPLVYVCVLSQHTLPLYEACLTWQPQHVVLVVSKAFQQSASRFERQLRKTLPNTQLHRPDENTGTLYLEGDSLENDTQWVDQILRPYLAQPIFSELPLWLNLNGGTKSMSLILTTTMRWEKLDYRASSENRLTVSSINYSHYGQAGALTTLPAESRRLPQVQPIDVALLYNSTAKEVTPNPLRDNPQSLPLAKRIFQGIEDNELGLSNVLSVLDNVWSRQRNAEHYQNKKLTLPLSDFCGAANGDSSAEELSLTWLNRFSTLCPEFFLVIGNAVQLPGNTRRLSKGAAAFKKWISGDWLEQLARSWLEKAGIPAANISGNLAVESTAGQSATGHETDLLIQHGSHTFQIEIKADLPPGQTANKLVEQLEGVNKFGLVQKILLIGPLLHQRLIDSDALRQVFQRCASNRITLVRNQLELAKAIKGNR